MLYNMYRMVLNILSREGTTATLNQLAATGTYVPSTGAYTPAATVSTTVKVVLLDYSATTSGLSTYTNTVIQAGDKQCYMDAKTDGVDLATKPSPAGDTLIVNGVTWRIMNVKEYNPTGSRTIMFDLLLRR